MSQVQENKSPSIYGVMAEFTSSDQLVEAAKKARAKGYQKIEAYSPFPVEELNEVLKLHDKRLPFLVLMAGICGALTGFGFQYYVSVIAYPIVAGGKPLNSWPAFIPVTFELTILFAAAAAVFGMIGINGLPTPYHPAFSAKNFERATLDRFFLCIRSEDAKFEPKDARQFLTTLKPESVEEVLP